MKDHHCHNCHELFYVASGSCSNLIDDDLYDLEEGSMILIPPLSLHYTRYTSGPCKRTVILFGKDDIAEDVRQCMPELFFSETTLIRIPGEYRRLIEGCIKEMEAEDGIRDIRSEPMRRCCLHVLLLLCSRFCSFQPGPPTEIRTTDRQILQAARYICEHSSQPLTSADVAREVGFSPNYLSRKFRLTAGIGLHEYLVFVRLRRAAQELVSTADPIGAIALRCGFSDSNYFKDSFKKKFGVTPREYRKLSSAPARKGRSS